MAKRKRAPWGDKFGKRPIERWFRRADPMQGEAAEKDALAELDRRMAQLAEYYGVDTYKNLALRLAAELDPAFTIVDPKARRRPTGLTAPKWKGQMGMQLVDIIEDVRDDLRRIRGMKRVTWKHVLAELNAPSMEATRSTLEFWKRQHDGAFPDFQSMTPETLRANHSAAVQHWTRLYGGEIRKRQSGQ